MANGLHLIKLECATWVQPECLIGCDRAARRWKTKTEHGNELGQTYLSSAEPRRCVFIFALFLNKNSFNLISVAFQRSSRGTYHVEQWVWWWRWSLQHCWRRHTRRWLRLGACARAEFWAPNQSRRRTLSPAGARDRIMLKEFFWFTTNEGPSTGKIKMDTKKKTEQIETFG